MLRLIADAAASSLLFSLGFLAIAVIEFLFGRAFLSRRLLTELGKPVNQNGPTGSIVRDPIVLFLYPCYWIIAILLVGVMPGWPFLVGLAIVLPAQLVHTSFVAFRAQRQPPAVIVMPALAGWLALTLCVVNFDLLFAASK